MSYMLAMIVEISWQLSFETSFKHFIRYLKLEYNTESGNMHIQNNLRLIMDNLPSYRRHMPEHIHDIAPHNT